MIGKLVTHTQLLLLLVPPVSWTWWLVTGREPTTFLAALWVSLGMALAYVTTMLIDRVMVA